MTEARPFWKDKTPSGGFSQLSTQNTLTHLSTIYYLNHRFLDIGFSVILLSTLEYLKFLNYVPSSKTLYPLLNLRISCYLPP
jgi:hypothetical protein